MTEVSRLAQKQENAVYELFNAYQQEYKQGPDHLAHVLNEVNAERLRPDTYNPPTKPLWERDLVSEGFSQIGASIGRTMIEKGLISNTQRQQLISFEKQLGILHDPPPNPFRMARMDRQGALIELSMAAAKIDNHDAAGAAILRQDAQRKVSEAARLDAETQTDCALGTLDYELGRRLPPNTAYSPRTK